MRRAYTRPSYGRTYERYCREHYPAEADRICTEAERRYLELCKDMPDLGENMMAANMLDWYTIVAFYEASDHRMDGEALQLIKRRAVDNQRWIGRLVNGNTQHWPYRLFHLIYARYDRACREHQAKGEWRDAWRVEINPEHHEEGFSFHLIGCPIARHAREHGYEELLPYLCQTDHYMAGIMHARLIRRQTEILGGDYCDYWYVGDESEVAREHENLPEV